LEKQEQPFCTNKINEMTFILITYPKFMKILCCYFITIIKVSMFMGILNGQNIQTDKLVKMPLHQFEDWLIDQNHNQTLDWNQLSEVVSERLKNRDGIPNQTLLKTVKFSLSPVITKLSFIDAVLPNTNNEPYLAIDLYSLKSIYLDSELSANDSLRQINSLKMIPMIESEAIKLAKVLYFNYGQVGDRYLYRKDTLKAIEYYINARRFPFYLLKNSDDAHYFENIYVSASIGHIKAYRGNYPRLKELSFIPAAFEDILPTYKMFIENAGGRCQICDDYYINTPPRGFKSVPPIEEKN